jgi:3-hydroxyisobutyrate dehydrogenase
MARHIIEAGIPTTLWARSAASLEPYEGTGASFATTAAELAQACDLVGVCVWDDDGVEDVLLGSEGIFAGMRPGGIVAIHSTISPETVRRMGEAAAAHDLVLLDAPVSGDREANLGGNLLVMVGGPRDAFERCEPVFSAFGGAAVVYLGELGSGTLTKLVNNVLLASIVALTSDALDLGEDYGLDRAQLAAALVHGSAAKGAAMGMHVDQGAVGLTNPGTPTPRVVGSWARKDVGLAIDAAERVGAKTDGDLMKLGLRAADLLEQRFNNHE